jgi:hypothetical protein
VFQNLIGNAIKFRRRDVPATIQVTVDTAVSPYGPRLCGQVRGVAPGAGLRLDLFGPYLSGGLGISVDCAGTWITGRAAAVWSGVSVRCSAGPILRFASRP